jgi:hypothetical protein
MFIQRKFIKYASMYIITKINGKNPNTPRERIKFTSFILKLASQKYSSVETGTTEKARVSIH